MAAFNTPYPVRPSKAQGNEGVQVIPLDRNQPIARLFADFVGRYLVRAAIQYLGPSLILELKQLMQDFMEFFMGLDVPSKRSSWVALPKSPSEGVAIVIYVLAHDCSLFWLRISAVLCDLPLRHAAAQRSL